MKTWFSPWLVIKALTRFNCLWYWNFLLGRDHWIVKRTITITEDTCLFGFSLLIVKRHWVLILDTDGQVLYRSPTASPELVQHYMDQLNNHTDWFQRFKVQEKEAA